MIKIENIKFHWPGQRSPQIDICDLELAQGHRMFISGQSGCGKSTLLSLIAGISVPDSGLVMVADRDLTQMKASKRDAFRADHLGLIFQQFNLLPYLNVLENVTLPCYFSALRKSRVSGGLEVEAKRLLSALGLGEGLHRQPVTALSIGQQQRVAVARALIGKPSLVIADEPTSALDHDSRDKFLSLLVEQCEASNSSLIFVSHDHTLKSHFNEVVSLPDINRAFLSDDKKESALSGEGSSL
ncbi:methionine ABC transporter ATP-binding protein [Veronia nyctiphanis]|uniref:Methionine ABC transporter ATP-binding protein n=1 Tax=Veronia nyctiphanis TaxID=1278244 RepID=A0A4Q0YMM2_9GAMM|nr:ABC transporter ATP-binding protein [Veronia nyctiphanis]RXJ72110.1 methionine ABC transporter ATP-binding protein [Veronia nyctiphanis]